MSFYKLLKCWQEDFIAVRRNYKFMGSVFLFFTLLGITSSLNQIFVHLLGFTDAYFTNVASQIIVPLVLTVATYPRDKIT